MQLTTNQNEQGRLGAAYELIGPAPRAWADVPLLLRVRVRNTGTATWPNRGAQPVNLSYHWLDEQGQVADFEGVRSLFDAPVRPGEQAELELAVEPPPHPGAYHLALDLVEEGVGWFSLRGVHALRIPLTVEAAPPRPRACIVSPICLINDAVGNHVINQLRFFQARGYQALALVEHVDLRQPAELRQHMVAIAADDLRAGLTTPLTRRALAHFRSSDIYIFHYPIYYPLFEAITLVERGVVAVDYHGITPPQLWDGAEEGYAGLVQGHRKLQLVRYADYAIAHSSYTRDELIHTGAIAPERVFVNVLPVSLGRFRPAARPPALMARYGLAPDQPILLYVGRMAANKRVPDLVAALALIRARFPDAALLLVGDDRPAPYAQVVAEARALAGRLGVAEGLIVTGQVPDAELAAHYQLADVFVTASVHEGFCIPVLEAMACGLPVVGAHAAALPETIGEAGRTFRPRDPADLAHQVLALLESRDAYTAVPSLSEPVDV